VIKEREVQRYILKYARESVNWYMNARLLRSLLAVQKKKQLDHLPTCACQYQAGRQVFIPPPFLTACNRQDWGPFQKWNWPPFL
jgi:hypothetical protein